MLIIVNYILINQIIVYFNCLWDVTMKRFIAIDGLDGSGKDTQARLIKEKYENDVFGDNTCI